LNSTAKRNFILYCIIAALFAGSLAVWFFMGRVSSDKTIAEIYKNGTLLRAIDLSAVHEEYVLSEYTAGGKNEVLVKQGEIGVIKADCPDQMCVNTGFISSGSFIPIICLPNRLEIRITGVDSDLDAIAR